MDLEQRVVELERRATRYRNTLVLLVVGVCAIAVVGATTDDGVISGRTLFLMNDQGEVVIYAGASSRGNGLLTVASKSGTHLIYAGADTEDNGQLKVMSKLGTDLIYAGANTSGNGFFFEGYNKTGEGVVQLYADEYGNGLVGAYNRKGKGKTWQDGILRRWEMKWQ